MNRTLSAINNQNGTGGSPTQSRGYHSAHIIAACLLLPLLILLSGCRCANQCNPCGGGGGIFGLGLLDRPILQRPILNRPIFGGQQCQPACQPPALQGYPAPAVNYQGAIPVANNPQCVCPPGQVQTVRYQSADYGSVDQALDRIEFQQSNQTESAPRAPVDKQNLVLDVRIEGNKFVPTHHLTRNIRTRPGRYFDPDRLQQDVDQLWRLPEIRRVNGPFINRTPDGVVITINVEERHRLNKVEFIGNRGIPDRALKKEIGIEDGQPLDMHEVRMAKTKLEEYYKEKGYPRTQVEIVEGDEPEDANVVFLIHEDQKQRVWNVEFEGNEIASDARLKHFIKSKPGILKVFGGLVKRDAIKQDIVRLTDYYRSLGFFNARIGREVTESNDGRWLTLRFIIDEGPRYRVRNVSFIGNTAYSESQLQSMLELKPTGPAKGQPEFNVSKMNQDVVKLRDLYGSQGFVFVKVEAAPRFLEEPGLLDLVYKIDEGRQYRVGNVNVHIDGDYGITRREVVLNRLSLRPGDLIDVREIRNSERRFGSARIFAGMEPGSQGQPPKIVVRPPEIKQLERMANGGMGGGSSSGGSGSRY